MKQRTLFLVALLAVASPLLLGGCAVDFATHATTPPQPTVGQQLIDLQKARDAGALSESEYQAQREKFLARR